MDGPKRKYQINLQNRRKTREILSEYIIKIKATKIINGFHKIGCIYKQFCI